MYETCPLTWGRWSLVREKGNQVDISGGDRPEIGRTSSIFTPTRKIAALRAANGGARFVFSGRKCSSVM